MIDLQNFKLLKEDDSTYEIGHPNGKKLTVSKKDLSEKAHKAIAELKQQPEKMSEGAEIDDVEDELSPAAKGQFLNYTPAQQERGAEQGVYQVPQSPMMPVGYVMPETNKQAVNVPFSPISNPEMLPQEEKTLQDQAAQKGQPLNPMQQMLSSIEAEKKGYQTQASGQMQAASEQQKALKAQIQNIENSQNDFQTIFKNTQIKNDQLLDAYRNQKIDPNRVWNDASTGSKISAGIGLILGGMGSGLTHQPNLAAQMIDNSINRDLQAQMNDKSDKMNLYKINRENMQDEMQAKLQTLNQMYTATKYKLEQAQLGATNAQAKGALQLQMANLDQKKAMTAFQLALRQDDATDPALKIPYLNLTPDQQKQAYAALDKAKFVGQNMNNMLKLYDQAAEEMKGFSPVQYTKEKFVESPALSALKLMVQPILKDEMGRPNPIANEAFNKILPFAFAGEGRIKENREALINFMNSHAADGSSQLKSLGINLPRYQQQLQKPQGQPGQLIEIKNKGMFKIGPDGNSLIKIQ